jgi:hypothetical protein
MMREAQIAILAGILAALIGAICLGALMKETRAGTIIPVPNVEEILKGL